MHGATHLKIFTVSPVPICKKIKTFMEHHHLKSNNNWSRNSDDTHRNGCGQGIGIGIGISISNGNGIGIGIGIGISNGIGIGNGIGNGNDNGNVKMHW